MAIKELFYDQRPVALLNPRASQRIDPRFKFTRNSPTTVNKDGVITQVPAGEPIVGFDSPGSEASANEGLRLEQSTTNIFWYSSNFTAEWYASSANLTVTKNAGTAPDGSNNAALIYQNAPCGNNQARFALFAGGFAITTTGQHVYSVFVKLQASATVNKVGFAIGDSGFSHLPGQTANYLSISFDFDSAGVLTSSTSPYGKHVYCGNGWYRIWMPMHKAVGVTNPIVPALAIIAGVEDNQPAGYYGRFLVWGPQFETTNGSITPTSYIYTPSGSSVTREADLLSVDSINIPSGGSIYVDSQATSAALNSTLLSLKNASNQKINLAMEQRSELYNSLALTYSIKGTVKLTLPYPVPTTNRERNIITWGSQNYQYNTDGARFAPSLSTTPGIPANLTQLSIGHDAVDPTKAFNGYINAVYLYNGEITPTVAEALVRGELDPVNADTYSPVGPTGSLALIINTQGASSSGDKVFALPAKSSLNDNDIVITWGDGTESGLDGPAAELGAPGLSHTYASAGIYPVWVEGKLENLQFNNSASANDLVKIEAWGTTADNNDVFLSPSTMNSAFYGCSKLTSMPSSGLPDTSAVTDWYRAFRDCSSLTGIFPSFNFSAATSMSEVCNGCSSLVAFAAVGDQTQNVTNFAAAWRDCSSLTSFPQINTSSGTSFQNSWSGCSSLTTFPLLATSAGTDFSYAWRNCSGLTAFPLINTPSGTNFNSAWYGCSGLTSFPLINTPSGTNFNSAWYGCSGLTSFPLINTSSGTNFNSAWYGCSGLTSFPLINTSSGTNFSLAWLNCSSLASFPLINTSSGTNFNSAWQSCTSLTSFPLIDTSAGTNFSLAWFNCSSLASFPALALNAATGLASDASSTYTGFRETWRSCTSLTDFPAGRFNTTTCTRYLDAWTGCALTAQSIENILVSINTANTSNGNLGIGGGTNAAKTTWSTAANNAYDALVARGWTITFNP